MRATFIAAVLAVVAAPALAETICDGDGPELLFEQRVFYGGGLICDHAITHDAPLVGVVISPATCWREAPGTDAGTVTAPDLSTLRVEVISPEVGVVTVGNQQFRTALCDTALEP